MEFMKDGWTPTGMLRYLEKDGAKVLQQMWARMEGRRIAEWRDVPTESDDWAEGRRHTSNLT